MNKNYVKNLKKEIKRLRKENKFLQIGVESREDAYSCLDEQLATQAALLQEICFLLLYMEVVESILTKDHSTNARTIKRAITKFKMELSSGFYANHLIDKLNLDKNDITV